MYKIQEFPFYHKDLKPILYFTNKGQIDEILKFIYYFKGDDDDSSKSPNNDPAKNLAGSTNSPTKTASKLPKIPKLVDKTKIIVNSANAAIAKSKVATNTVLPSGSSTASASSSGSSTASASYASAAASTPSTSGQVKKSSALDISLSGIFDKQSNTTKKRLREDTDTDTESDVSDVSEVDTDECSSAYSSEDEEKEIEEAVKDKREKRKQTERKERIHRQNIKKLTKKTYNELSKNPFHIDVRADSLNENDYKLDQIDYDQVAIGLTQLMFAEISKGTNWDVGETGILLDEGIIYIEARNKETYDALVKGVRKFPVPEVCKANYKYTTGLAPKKTRTVKFFAKTNFWCKRDLIELMIRNSNNSIRNFVVTEKDGSTRPPKIRVIGGGEDKDKETIVTKKGEDLFVVTVELEECLMQPIVYDAPYGQEGYINYGPAIKVQLQGGGMEKLVREKKLADAKASGKQRKKRELTDAEKAEKKRLRKGKKLDKKIKARRESKQKSGLDEASKKAKHNG